jgi:hypothetical protein
VGNRSQSPTRVVGTRSQSPETQTPVVLPARGAGPPVKDGTTGVRWCLGPRSKGATQRCAGARVLLGGHHLTVHLGQIDHWITSFVSAGIDERSLSTAAREETAGVSPRPWPPAGCRRCDLCTSRPGCQVWRTNYAPVLSLSSQTRANLPHSRVNRRTHDSRRRTGTAVARAGKHLALTVQPPLP